MATIQENLNTIKNALNTMKTNLGLEENASLETVVESTSGGTGGIEVVNGKLDTGYYSSSGAIAPGTFINTSSLVDPIELQISGSIKDVARLDDEKFIVASYDSYYAKGYLYIIKGTEIIAQTLIEYGSSSYGSAKYKICTANDGSNIFVLAGNAASTARFIHYSFENNILNKKSFVDTDTKGSNYSMSSVGISYIKQVDDTFYCVAITSYDNNPYAMVFTSNGSSASIGTMKFMYDNNNHGLDFGGITKIDDNNAMVSMTYITSYNGTVGVGEFLLTLDGTSLTYSQLSGSPTRQPNLLRANDTTILVANREADTNNLIIDKYSVNGSNVNYDGVQVVSNYGTNSPYITTMEKINNNNFIIIHTYYDADTSSKTIKYIPCTIYDDIITYGNIQTINQSISSFLKALNYSNNKINIFMDNLLISGTLNGLEFNIGVKYVSQATKSITGITKTECTESVPGDIYLLNTEAASNE